MADRVAGLRIRYLRKKKGLSLQQMADHIGRSVGFISQIERGISTPGSDDIEAIAGLLNIDVQSLFTDDAPTPSHPVLVRHGERSSLDYRPGINDQLLSPSIAGNFHMLYTEIQPGASSTDAARDEAGEQGGIVLEGELELTVNEETFLLKPGDSFQFASGSPHKYINRTATITRLVWVVALR